MDKRDNQQAKTSTGTEEVRKPNGLSVSVNCTSDPEVEARTTRRRLTSAYKLKVLKHVDRLRQEGNGAIGAYLRT